MTTPGQVTLETAKLKGIRSATAIVNRYKCREASVEEVMIEVYLAGMSTRRIEGVSEILWGASVSAGIVSNLDDRAFEAAELESMKLALRSNACAMGMSKY